jgi:NAD(P)H-flavin reductase
MSAKAFHLPILKKERIAKGTYRILFDMQQTHFSFLPGQYIHMILPHRNADERGTARYFTISSSPTENEYLFIITKKGVSSFKKALFGLKKGTNVQFFGPIGKFVLDEL